jgi:hypothetical protein
LPRRNTATSCRRIRISAFFDADGRADSAQLEDGPQFACTIVACRYAVRNVARSPRAARR